ncbi:MAG: murein biosynthesis integral membrane protein MurJ [Chitinophagales bacterium]
MVKSTIQVTLFSILGIGINFLIQLLLAYYFGATAERDAYFAALTIPAYITVLFTGSIGMMLLPYLVRFQESGNREQMIGFANAVINFCFLLLAAIIASGYFLARPILHILLPASKQDMLPIAVSLFQIQMLSIVFTVLSNLLAAFFQSRHSFLVPALFPILTGMGTVIWVVLFHSSLGIKSLAIGNLIGAMVSFSFMYISVLHSPGYKWTISLNQEGLSKILLASLPLFLAGIFFRSTTVIERFLAARLPQGSLSYLGSANQIVVVLSTIVSSGIATTSFPLLSKYWTNKDLLTLEKTFTRVISLVVLLIFPMITIFAISGIDLIHLLFERGAFTSKDTVALYYTLLGLMGFFLFSSLGNVVQRILYLSHHAMAVAVIATMEVLIYLVSAWILSSYFQYVGLALSMSFASGCNIIISFFFIDRRVISLDMKRLIRRIIYLLILSIALFFLLHYLNQLLLPYLGGTFRVIIQSILVAASYTLFVATIFRNIGYKPFLQPKQ